MYRRECGAERRDVLFVTSAMILVCQFPTILKDMLMRLMATRPHQGTERRARGRKEKLRRKVSGVHVGMRSPHRMWAMFLFVVSLTMR